ncbi:MAG: sulfotransferase [Deinococcota bacterium]
MSLPEDTKAVSQEPFFIVGMPRAGTTLLARMLDCHPACAVFPEATMFRLLDYFGCAEHFTTVWQYRLWLNFLYAGFARYDDPAAWCVAKLALNAPTYQGTTRKLVDALAELYCQQKDAQLWSEKTPVHALHLPELYKLYPNARLVCLMRDPKDVLTSHVTRWNAGKARDSFVFNRAASLKNYLYQLRQNNPFSADAQVWLRYEDLTQAPEPELQRICAFLGVDYDDKMLEFHQHSIMPENLRVHHLRLEQPLTTSRQGRYKKMFSAIQQQMLAQFFHEELEAFNYDLPAKVNESISISRQFIKMYAHLGYYARRYELQLARVKAQGRLHLLAYQLFGKQMGRWQNYNLAYSEADWCARLATNDAKRLQQPDD